MKSPFPGMDPYLEASWGDVQSSLAIYIRDLLNTQMPTGLRARVESSVAVEVDDPTDDEVVSYYPDVEVYQPERPVPASGGVAVAAATEPIYLRRVPEPDTQRSIRIVTADGGQLVTAIEILSPSNKIGRSGREAYKTKQQIMLSGGASLVEIDLIRAGRHVLAVPLTRLPKRARQTYKVVVVRGWARDRAEVYPWSIRGPLPVVRMPLRKNDPDANLDLQAVLSLAYKNGGYDTIDYRDRLEPNLSPDDAAWADALLKAAGKR